MYLDHNKNGALLNESLAFCHLTIYLSGALNITIRHFELDSYA